MDVLLPQVILIVLGAGMVVAAGIAWDVRNDAARGGIFWAVVVFSALTGLALAHAALLFYVAYCAGVRGGV